MSMCEVKDPAIRLFGQVIQCQCPPPHNEERHSSSGNELSDASVDDVAPDYNNCSSEQNMDTTDNKSASTDLGHYKQEAVSSNTVISERSKDAAGPGTSSVINDDHPDKDSSSLPSSKKEDQGETSTSQEKTPLKKPDKILPCPRCNSMDTKFCYFNNYNVNQPRHFCKNCQRYWTAGGTMRNVPVGAGRRRNKNSCTSNQRHLVLPDGFQTARPANIINGIVHPALRAANGTILAFGPNSPLCESMSSALSLGENSLNCIPNGFIRGEHRGNHVSSGGPNNGYADQSSGSCNASSTPVEKGSSEQESAVKNIQGIPAQGPCFQEPHWHYPYNPTQWSSTMHPPPLLPSGIPVPFYAAPPYWGCGMPAGSWNVSWTPSAPVSTDQSSTNSSPNSPLGKHTRDGNMLNNLSTSSSDRQDPSSERKETERRVLVPKTLRIDDPSEAAKSSIWATLGIKNDKANSVHRGGSLFEGFQLSGGDGRNSGHTGKSLLMREANPAAMSRSLTFQESAE